MRMINTERNFLRSGGWLKDRQGLIGNVELHEASCSSSPSKSLKLCMNYRFPSRPSSAPGGGGGACVSDIAAQNYCRHCWRSHSSGCSKGGLILSSFLLFLLLFILISSGREDWQLPCLYSTDSEAVQLIPPVRPAMKPLALQVSQDKWMPLSRRQRRSSLLSTEGEFLENNKASPRVVGNEYQIGQASLHQTIDRGALSSNDLGLSNDMKIFVYDLPSRFNEDWLVDNRCSSHLFAAEVAIHKRLLNSSLRTLEPSKADFFFVPVYVSCNFNTSTGFPSLGHARSLMRSAVKLVSHDMPYWNESKGKNHIFVATHDYGACFHTMEDMALAAGIPNFLQKSIILQTFGKRGHHVCQTENSIQIPPFVPASAIDSEWHPEKKHRDIWAYFRGKIELHPKNVSGRVYSRGIRSTIWQKFRHNRRFFIERTRSPDYHEEIKRSTFCLCPLGWAPWSPRIVESVIFGCVPVIIADKIALPYSHRIDWSKISVNVAEKDVGKLSKILNRVSMTNLTQIQANLWNSDYRKALLYMDPMAKGDATWQVFELLSRRLNTNINQFK